MTRDLYVRTAGTGQPALVLLHGLGVNGAVWEPFLPYLRGWPGRIVVPDLRGHGRSPHAEAYSDKAHAADVAELIADEREVYVIGHSMGGMIALVLSNGSYVANVKGVFVFGLKTAWTEAELGKLTEFAQKPARRFASAEEARGRFLRTAGLEGLVEPDAPVVEAGIAPDGNGYRLAADPRTAMVAGTSAEASYRASKVPRWLACGANDSLVTLAQLRAIDPAAIALGETGHNTHVQDPGELAAAVPFLQAITVRTSPP
jgi:pimeloyl-ACP methyl ester carboxylesterase